MEFQKVKTKITEICGLIFGFISHHKTAVSVGAVITVLCIVSLTGAAYVLKKHPEPEHADSMLSVSQTVESLAEITADDVLSEEEPEESSQPESTEPAPSSAIKPAVKKETPAKKTESTKPVISTGYKYNTNSDIDNNIFLDALIYTGYNIEKHRSDGKMWQYILAANKRGLGYLSKITYGGGSSGYETANGNPDIKYFEKHGLVCASYVTYVYFNYLPNAAGINTSSLPKPARPTSANDWYTALKQWVNKGYSKKIPFTASKTSSGFISFKPAENIPIGSVIVFCDAKNRSDYGSHVAIYAGYKNNYSWLFHVGNKNGPEFCAVERMYFGPDPQWPIAVITPPSNIRMSALLEITVTDDSGNPVSGSSVSLKNSKTGAVISLGTVSGGRLIKEGLSYGDYTLSFTVPDGYTADSTLKSIKLTTAQNSKNTINLTLSVKPPVSEPTPAESSESSADSDESGSVDSVTSETSSDEALTSETVD